MRPKPGLKTDPEKTTPFLRASILISDDVHREREEEENTVHIRYVWVPGTEIEENEADTDTGRGAVQSEDRK